MSVDMIKCSNCGAEIDSHIDKCPFCGYINSDGAEEKYMGTLEDVRKKLDVVDEEAAEEYKNSTMKLVKIVSVTLAVLVVLTVVVLAFSRTVDRMFVSETTSAKDDLKNLAYTAELYPKLDELFDAGEYDKLLEMYDAESKEHQIWNYSHSQFIGYYRDYSTIFSMYLPRLDDGEADDYDFGYLTSNSLLFYYRAYDSSVATYAGKLTPKELSVLDGIREDYILDVVYNRLGFSDEELEGIMTDVIKNGNYNTSEAKRVAKKYSERYK